MAGFAGMQTKKYPASIAQTDEISRLVMMPNAELEAVFCDASSGFAVIGIDSKFHYVNNAFAMANGLSPEDYVGRTIRQLFPDIADQAETALREIAATGRISSATASDAVANVNWFKDCSLVKDSLGGVIAVNVLIEDPALAGRAGHDQKESESRLALALRAGRLGMLEVIFKPEVSYKSDDTLRQFWGLDANDEITDELFWSSILPDDVPIVKSAWAIGMDPNGPRQFRIVHRILRLSDGQTRWLHFECNADFAGDQPVRVIGVVRDITAQKKVELRNSAINDRDTYLLKLSDAIRNWTDPRDIQAAASDVLGRHLRAQRVGYAEAMDNGISIAVRQDYTCGVASLSGVYETRRYGEELDRNIRSGRTVVSPDIANDASFTSKQKLALAAVDIAAMINVPLVKSGRLFAVMFVHFSDPHQFTSFEQDLVTETAEMTWAAVERAKAEEERGLSERRLRMASDAAGLGFYEFDVDRQRSYWSSGMWKLVGWQETATVPYPQCLETVHKDDREFARVQMQRAARTPGPFECEYRIQRPDGKVVWVMDRGESFGPVDAKTGLAARIMGTLIDVTERKSAEDNIRILMREVNHRSKNLLSVVQSIARQTATYGEADSFVERFGDRLSSLAASQDLIISNSWRGVELSELVRSQLSHFKDLIGDRIRIDGPSLNVSPAAAQHLGLALHELSTNAGKYGSLSTESGNVDVNWRIEGSVTSPSLKIEWIETGGPAVSAPTRKGLGFQLTTRLTQRAFDGEVTLDYQVTGLRWMLLAPVSRLIEAGQA
jgi:PAS domain S-box-containing protein